jgi:hypothetical protein
MQETRVVKGDPKHGYWRTGRRWWDFLAHRWPTALGVAIAAMMAFDLRVDAEFISSLSALIVVMALVYVGAAALGRRRASWVVLLAGLPVAFFVPSTLGIKPSVILLLAAAIFLVVGAVRGRSGEASGLALQAAGVLVFGATSPGVGGLVAETLPRGVSTSDVERQAGKPRYCSVLETQASRTSVVPARWHEGKLTRNPTPLPDGERARSCASRAPCRVPLELSTPDIFPRLPD